MKPGEAFLSQTDWQVMSAVWELEQADAAQVAVRLRDKHDNPCSAKTAGILLARLVRKGHLRSAVTTPEGRGRPAHVYSPILTKQQALRTQMRSFLEAHSVTPGEVEILCSVLAEASERS